MARKKPASLKFKVQLRNTENPAQVDCPEFEVEAFDRLDAIDQYKKKCGILHTIHDFSVVEVVDPNAEDQVFA